MNTITGECGCPGVFGNWENAPVEYSTVRMGLWPIQLNFKLNDQISLGSFTELAISEANCCPGLESKEIPWELYRPTEVQLSPAEAPAQQLEQGS